MKEKTKTIEVKVKSKRKCVDHFLENDEPNTERTTLEVEPLSESTVRRVDYSFHWRDWIRGISETKGYENYFKFTKTNIGDVLKINYYAAKDNPIALELREGDYWWPPSCDIDYSDIISENASPEEFKIWNERIMRRALLENCNDLIPSPSALIESIENLTQNWKIDKFVLEEY